MSAKKPTVETQACPNCDAQLTVPKSTRSFICKSCDAILRVFSSDEGVELKVVGKSVDDDPTFQALESRIAELKAELGELHATYEAAALKPIDKAGARVRLLGVLGVVVGLGVAIADVRLGAIVAGIGVALAAVGHVVNAMQLRAKQAGLSDLTANIARLAEERDNTQRRAAMMNIKST